MLRCNTHMLCARDNNPAQIRLRAGTASVRPPPHPRKFPVLVRGHSCVGPGGRCRASSP
jgi:hypothetical protein